jgi:Tfp pilus assembly protein PilF
MLGGALSVALLASSPSLALAAAIVTDSFSLRGPFSPEGGKPAEPGVGQDVAHFRTAMDALGQGNLDIAAANFHAAAEAAPKAPGPHIGLAEVALRRGDSSAAESELKKALKLAPDNPLVHSSWAHYLMQKKDFPAALAELDKTIALAPTWSNLHIDRGDILAGQGKTQEAIAAYKTALERNSRSVAALVRLAAEEEKAKHPGAAEKDYRAVLAIDPQNLIATNNLAFLLAEEKRELDDALRLAESAVERLPDSQTALDTLAWVHRARGELPAAEKILQPLAGNTKDPALPYHLGVIYLEMGRKQDAVAAFGEALKLAPEYAQAREAFQNLAGTPAR